MRFSSKTEYGLRAMANLAASFPEVKSLNKVAEEEKISIKYLERLIGILKKKRLVISFKGKNGGYILAQKPQEISIGIIVETLDGPITIMGCEREKCGAKNCRPKGLWLRLGKQIRKHLYEIKLSNLI